MLVPLSSLGSISAVSKLNPANVAETTYNGKLYAMPLATNTIAIFYNKTLVQQAGITTLPKTWAEFAADAKKTAHGSDLGFVFSGQAGPGQATWQFDPWAWSNGGSMEDPAGTASGAGAVLPRQPGQRRKRRRRTWSTGARVSLSRSSRPARPPSTRTACGTSRVCRPSSRS